jgi:glucose/arabinose dehydrogenase/mono/diheme cytochrome c family protein
LLLKGEEMRSSGQTAGVRAVQPAGGAPAAHRKISFRVALTLLVSIIGLTWLAKGTGMKTWFVRTISHNQPVNAHLSTVSPLAAKVRLDSDPLVRFERVQLPITSGTVFTCVRVGPDGKLYASSIDGLLFRYPVNPDGTLATPRVFNSLQRANHGPRLLTGFCFDPLSTPETPVLWAANGQFGFADVPDFTGKITRIGGQDFSTVEDVIVGLPRSVRDHLTNQPKFGPDGALYIPQGSNSAYGAPDPGWGNRPERVLSGTVLRFDTSRATPGEPLDVTTVDGGGCYDPFAADAPLTIYACGIRNAWSMVWTHDGKLYVPVNGSSAGGNAPAGGDAPGLTNIQLDEDDWLFHVRQGGYYGHPNPQLGHYVLNGGNPGGPQTSATIPLYPPGTKPDPIWTPAVYDFGPHVSANGVVEYVGAAFGGRLNHMLVVCRFNAGSDLVSVLSDETGEFTYARSIAGSEDLNQPLDVTEDTRTGNLYVCEYGAKKLTLLRPMSDDRIARALTRASQVSLPLAAHVETGRQLFNSTCIACHGVRGQGIPNLGANLQQSKFITESPDDSLVMFLKTGRMPGDSRSVLNLTMPPRGGNPSLDDKSLHDIVAYLRILQTDGRTAMVPTTQPVAATRD